MPQIPTASRAQPRQSGRETVSALNLLSSFFPSHHEKIPRLALPVRRAVNCCHKTALPLLDQNALLVRMGKQQPSRHTCIRARTAQQRVSGLGGCAVLQLIFLFADGINSPESISWAYVPTSPLKLAEVISRGPVCAGC